jgi:RluA family pseudouridine synthase
MKFSSRVPADRGQSIPLIEYLADRFTYFSQDQWCDRVLEGRITVEDLCATPVTRVCGGQTIIYDAGDFEEPPADCSYSIIYEDEWLMAVNKPGNLLIHRAGKSFKNNLMYQLRCVHNPPFPEVHSIHRLDRNTSGIVLIAKSPAVQATISLQFRDRQIQKLYIAFVEGIPAPGTSIICKPIGSDNALSGGCRFRIDAEGKEAITHIERCEPLGSSFAQLTLRPVTGRTHQIRVHCASIGHPIFGDTTYGSCFTMADTIGDKIGNVKYTALHPRHALHCSQIRFYHPWLEKECLIDAALPEDLELLRKKLRQE